MVIFKYLYTKTENQNDADKIILDFVFRFAYF